MDYGDLLAQVGQWYVKMEALFGIRSGEILLSVQMGKELESVQKIWQKKLISILGELQQTLGENQSGVSLLKNLDAVSEWVSNSKYSDLTVVKTGFAIHLMEPNLSKGEGLAVALEKMQISPDDVLAVGDAPNDISMFEYLGRSVAVGGCFQELADVADVVSPHMHGDTSLPLWKVY